MKKKVSLVGVLFSLLIISLPSVLAAEALSNIWNRIISIGNLSFLGIGDASLVVGFTRILVGILVFALFFALLKNLKQLDFLEKQAAIVAGILAIISAVFMPASVLLGIGAGWGTAVALIFIWAPIVGVAYLLYVIPGKDNETKFTVFIKFLLTLILFWILTAMKFHIGKMTARTMAVVVSMNQFLDWAIGIVTLMIIYYIIKFFLVGGETEEELKGRREKVKEFLKGRSEKEVEKKAKESKKKVRGEKEAQVSPIKENIKDAIEDCDNLIAHLDSKKPKEAKKAAKKFRKHMRGVWIYLKFLLRKVKGGDRELVMKMQREVEAIRKDFEDKVRDKLPKKVGKNWAKKVEPIRKKVVKLRSACGVIWKRLEKFHG